ncbi:MAG: DHH family phosphoesterase [Candidatus Kariarchaeaceae archaeon]
MTRCAIDNTELSEGESFLCATCTENPIIIQLAQPLDQKYLAGDRALAATIINVDGRGALVDLGAGFKGTFKPAKGTYYNQGQTVPVRLKSALNPKERGKKPAEVRPLQLDGFKVVKKHLPVDPMTVAEVSQEEGNVGELFVQVTDIFQIRNGPTLFTVIDTQGKKIQASAYGDGHQQAYPSVMRNTVVRIIGRFRIYNDQERIQVYSMEKVKASEAMNFMENLASINQRDGTQLDTLEFFVESEVYNELKPRFVEAAKRIRSAVLRNQNIILRYHSPCVDGTVGAYALDFAIRRYLATRGARKDEFRRALRRLPHRSPIFEVSDVSRDLSFALDDSGSQHTLPLYILVDLGSSEDSQAALDFCNAYGVDVVIIDHHALAEGIDEKSHTLINPNVVSENAMISSGMLATELANYIAAEQDLEKRVIHLAALSGYADKIEGSELDAYLAKSEEYEFDASKLENIKYALEYVSFGLRFLDGGEVIRNILGVSGPRTRTNDLIESITPTAKSLFTKSLKIMEQHAHTEELGNGVMYYQVDLDNYTPRISYPPHSELLFEFHIDKVENSESDVISVGVSDSYIIVRSSDHNFSFMGFLEKLQSQLPEFGITGGGHNTFGSLQFYTGHQAKILETIKEVLGS